MATKTRAKSGAALIAAERQRQKRVEGWTAAHDDEHIHGELATAAARYAEVAGVWKPDERTGTPYASCPMNWPWDAKWWKPTGDAVRDLVKAGALIAAEIDRLQRRDASRERSSGEHLDLSASLERPQVRLQEPGP